MVSKRELLKQFRDLGMNVQEDVLNCAMDMCGRLFIDEREIVETWMAFSLTHLNSAKPSVDLLLKMEQKEFAERSLVTPKRSSTDASILSTPCEKLNNGSNVHDLAFQEMNFVTTPKKSKLSEPTTPNFSTPASVPAKSPTPSKYITRENAGELLSSHGESCCDWKAVGSVTVEPILQNSEWLSMHSTLIENKKILEEATKKLAKNIAKKNGLSILDQTKISDDSEVNTLFGRVRCDETSRITSNIITVASPGEVDYIVDISLIKEYAIFPGQVIVFKGKKKGKHIIASEIFTSARLPSSTDIIPSLTEAIQLVVAAGPFNLAGSSSYEPLNDLLAIISKRKPHVLLIIGPIIDANNPDTKANLISSTFSELYFKLLKLIEKTTKETQTKLYVLSSSKDACNLPIYPTKPMSGGPEWLDVLLPDPAVINVNGFIIGTSSTDVLLQLATKEFSNMGNKFGRLGSYLIDQNSFYPLYPPDNNVSIDINLWNHHAKLTVDPHILILPSDLHHFIKVVDNVLVINPQKIVKGSAGGSFACIEIQQPSDSTKWSATKNSAVKIYKI